MIEVIKGSIDQIAKKEAEGAAKAEIATLQKGLEEKLTKSLEGVVSKEDFDKMENEFKRQLKGYEDKVKKEISFDAALSESLIKSMDNLKSFQRGDISKSKK